MIDLTSHNTVNEAYADIESQYEGTPFEGFVDVYRDHEDIVRFFVESSDDFIPDAYIGSHESFIKDGVDINDEELVTAVEESNHIDLLDFLRLGRDIAEFYHQVISEHTDTWTDVTELLASVSELSAEEIDSLFREQHQETLEEIDELSNELEGEDEDAVEQLESVREELRDKNLRDVFLEGFEMQAQMTAMGLDLFSYGDVEMEVGKYFVYEVTPHRNHLAKIDEYNFDFSANTLFNVIGKLTGEREIDDEVGTQLEYEFDLIAYDSDVKNLYPNFWMFEDDARIQPQHSSDLTLFEENPIGDIRPRIN